MGFYLAGIAALLGAAVALRLAHGTAGERVLTPELAGYLTAGPRRAVHAAIALLRRDGLVAVSWAGSLKRMDAARELGPLPGAIYEAIDRPTRAAALAGDAQVRQALAAIRAELATGGLVTRPWRRWSLGLLAAAVVGLGLAATAGEPSGWLPAIAAASIAVAVGLCWLPRTTPAGRRALRALRDQFQDDDACMAVALYGRLDIAGIENITARPRRRSRSGGPDHTHSPAPDPPWLNSAGSGF
jgi:uncharacterized protein (TIGR04222 family)